MNYRSLVLFLLFSSTLPCNNLTHKEQMALEQQMEKDRQEYRLKVLATIGTVTVALIAGIVKIYLHSEK